MQYKLVRSFRKTLSLHVDHQGELVVKAPHLLPLSQINKFISEKENWIKKQQTRAANSHHILHTYENGDDFYYLGEKYALNINEKFNKRIVLQEGYFKTSLLLKSQIKKALIVWYRKKAREIFEVRLLVNAREMDLSYDKFRLSSARTRWGSCSSNRTISLNWKLIMAPLDLIDYVIIHELAHLRHPNHSKDFWKFVGDFCPDYKKKRKELKNDSLKFSI